MGRPGFGTRSTPCFRRQWILDDDHCCAHLDTVAGLQDRDHPERPYEWCEAAVARLFWGEVEGVIGGLQRMKPADAQAADEMDQLSRYVQRHQARLDDRFARKAGYPIGSGGIASANTFIGHVRLKRSGAWWDCDQRQPDAGPTLRNIPRHLCASV